MASMLDGLFEQLNQGGYVNKISGMLGTDEKTTGTALQSALPTIVAGLAKNASTPQGAAALHSAVTTNHDGSILDNGPEALQGAQGDGQKILGHVFGSQLGAVQSQLGTTSGIGAANAGSMLSMLAPLVMGYLGKQQSGGGLDIGGLTSMLGGSGAAGMLPGGLGQILGGGGSSNSGGGLGSIIGKIFGKR